MSDIYLFNKPYLVLSQFTDREGRATLADFINIKEISPAGRLDYDSEGLLILTADGALQNRISHPKHKLPKTYLVQVEGDIDTQAINSLKSGVQLKDGPTKPAKAIKIDTPKLWNREPPIRQRDNIPTSWLKLTITEGRNRQVRRMTAAVGFPTLRLVRQQIGPWSLNNLKPGEYTRITVNLPSTPKKNSNLTKPNKKRSSTHKRKSR